LAFIANFLAFLAFFLAFLAIFCIFWHFLEFIALKATLAFTTFYFSRVLPFGSITCPCIGMSSWACLFLSILIFAYCIFFRLVRSERPRYLYSDLCNQELSSRTANFIFPNVCQVGLLLVRARVRDSRLWNGLPLVIKESRSVAIFEKAVPARLATV
jgi:hypothetical protein